MDIREITEKLKTIQEPKRLEHSIGVMNASKVLAENYGAPVEKCVIAGLIHDCAKGMPGEELLKLAKKFGIVISNIYKAAPELLHAPVGAELARREFNIEDDEIFRAVWYHTTGCTDMTLIDKVLYLADYISEDRVFPGVEELRKVAGKDLNAAILMGMDITINHVISKKGLLHPDTIEARNDMLLKYPGLDYKSLL